MGPILGGYKKASFTAAAYAMTGDGNSIMASSLSDMLPQLAALPPISGQLAITNCGISGQTVIDMTTNASDVDAAFVAGRINYLLVWEITNNIFNIGRTGLQTCADLTSYIAARLAVHPWRVILMTAIPRGGYLGSTWNAVTGEQQLQAANTYIRANWRAMGAIALVEARRTGGPFDFTDSTTSANFPTPFWNNDLTHPGNGAGNGKSVLAGYIADVLKRLPAR